MSLVLSLIQGEQNPGMERTTRSGTFFRKPIGLEERGETENARFFLYPSMWLLVWLGNNVYTPLANTRSKLSQPNGQREKPAGSGDRTRGAVAHQP